MSPPFLFVLMVGFAFRVYRLIARDDLTAPIRERLSSGVQGFLNCGWCCGFWCSLATVAIVAQATNVPLPVLQAGAVSGAVGLIASNLDL